MAQMSSQNPSFDVSTQGMTQAAAGKREGRTTALIERQTSRLPSLAYLGLAVGSIAFSAALAASARPNRWYGSTRRLEFANFVGQWAPTLLVIGVYNKLVKIEDELLSQRGGSVR